MLFADDIRAARGSVRDMVGMITNLSKAIDSAERFLITDDVGRAAHMVLRSRPSSLLSALPLCRMPYRNTWFEWSGLSDLRESRRDETIAPRPVKMGCLVECLGEDHASGRMTWAWMHRGVKQDMITDDDRDQVMVGPFGTIFDWDENADLQISMNAVAQRQMDRIEDPLWREFINMARRRLLPLPSEQGVDAMMDGRSWRPFIKDKREREALRGLSRHGVAWLSSHAIPFLQQALHVNGMRLLETMPNWLADIEGEQGFIEAIVCMMNSRNCIEHEHEPLTKLNKARAKRGKPPLYPHRITRLSLSRSQARRADAAGITREAARQHIVRWHFKIRRTGVYWWSPFLRGDAKRPVERAEYDVVM